MAKASSTGVRPTIRMVAELAGVSTATVSYVLSGRRGDGGPGVSDPTAEKVKAAAERLGYRPNQAARAIRTGRTNTVILSLTMLSDPWSLSVIESVQKAAGSAGDHTDDPGRRRLGEGARHAQRGRRVCGRRP